jgi:hypothetical protein
MPDGHDVPMVGITQDIDGTGDEPAIFGLGMPPLFRSKTRAREQAGEICDP